MSWATGTKLSEDNKDKTKSNNETQKTKFKKDHNNNYKANNVKGANEELGRNTHCYGRRHQAEFFTKTTEAMGDYVGRECSEDMRNLAVDRTELSLNMPPELPGAANECKIEK